MTDGRSVLREVAWRELFPWLLLFRSFRLAILPGILLVALVGALVTPLGWALAHRAIWWNGPPETLATDLAEAEASLPKATEPEEAAQIRARIKRLKASQQLHLQATELQRLPGVGRVHDPDVLGRLRHPEKAFDRDASPVVFVFDRFTAPILGIYRTATDLPGFAYYLLGMLWTLAVWALAGGIITRMAALELGREEQASVRSAFRLTLRRWFDFFTAPLYPVLGTMLIALLSAPVGWILLSNAGTVVAGVLWIFVLIGGGLAALLLLWLFIGWPLMWPAISAEETGDSFEAMSRSFAYAFQRPLHYLFYVAVAALFGFICWSVVDFVCQLTIHAAHWAVSWGSWHERIATLEYLDVTDEDVPTALRVGATMIRGIEAILLALSEAFAYSFFWVAATAIYLILRLNVDRTEFDEVWADDDTTRYPLSPAATPAPPTTGTGETIPSDATPQASAIDQNQAE